MDIHPSRLSLGSKVSLITGAQYRYEGTVAAMNSIEGTLTLQNVCFWGTENRAPSNKALQNGENKAPAVGSIFDSITFWMSSIVQLWCTDEEKPERNDLGDKGIAKAGIPVDINRSRPRRPRSWWQAGDRPRSTMRGSPSNGMMDGLGTMSAPMGRYVPPMAQSMAPNPPRMLVSYPRRGRNQNMIPRQASYVPVVPIMSGPGGVRRPGYGPNVRGQPYRLLSAPVPNGPRVNGRKSGPPTRHQLSSMDDRRYSQVAMNPAGGVFVYLPPEMAAAYQSHGINLVPSRPMTSRRRFPDRRGISRGPDSTEPDCNTPYDFETANAELEAELAKITISPEGVPTTNTTQQTCEGNTPGLSNPTASTGDGHSGVIQSPSSTLSTGVLGTTAAGNGASGDSSLGVVTSTVTGSGMDTGSVALNGIEGTIPLAKGEYYVREKCFFDQISRSESAPKGSYDGTRTGFHQSNYGNPANYNLSGSGSNMRNNFGPGQNSIAAARRERQLNMETFGPMAARTAFAPRRRQPTGSSTREFLVSASA